MTVALSSVGLLSTCPLQWSEVSWPLVRCPPPLLQLDTAAIKTVVTRLIRHININWRDGMLSRRLCCYRASGGHTPAVIDWRVSRVNVATYNTTHHDMFWKLFTPIICRNKTLTWRDSETQHVALGTRVTRVTRARGRRAEARVSDLKIIVPSKNHEYTHAAMMIVNRSNKIDNIYNWWHWWHVISISGNGVGRTDRNNKSIFVCGRFISNI